MVILGLVDTGDPTWAEICPVSLDSASVRDSSRLYLDLPQWSLMERWARQNEAAFPAPRKETLNTGLSLALGPISCHFSCSK